MSKCRSCGASIDWVRTQSGKNMPVDDVEYLKYDEAPEGTILVTDGGTTMRVVKDVRFPSVKGRPSHFATCPERDSWRRGNAKS